MLEKEGKGYAEKKKRGIYAERKKDKVREREGGQRDRQTDIHRERERKRKTNRKEENWRKKKTQGERERKKKTDI